MTTGGLGLEVEETVEAVEEEEGELVDMEVLLVLLLLLLFMVEIGWVMTLFEFVVRDPVLVGRRIRPVPVIFVSLFLFYGCIFNVYIRINNCLLFFDYFMVCAV